MNRWHNPVANADLRKPIEALTTLERRRCAQIDLADIREATNLILFTPGGHSGGCYVDFGYALRRRLPGAA